MSTVIEALAHGQAVPTMSDPLAQRRPSEHVRILAQAILEIGPRNEEWPLDHGDGGPPPFKPEPIFRPQPKAFRIVPLELIEAAQDAVNNLNAHGPLNDGLAAMERLEKALAALPPIPSPQPEFAEVDEESFDRARDEELVAAEPINSHSRARLRGELVQIAMGCASATLTVDRILDRLCGAATGNYEAPRCFLDKVRKGEL